MGWGTPNQTISPLTNCISSTLLNENLFPESLPLVYRFLNNFLFRPVAQNLYEFVLMLGCVKVFLG